MKDPMETSTIDKLFLELSQVTKATTRKEIILLEAVKVSYKKHCLGLESIGWDELSKVLLDTLCEVMGDVGYQQWLNEENRKNVVNLRPNK